MPRDGFTLVELLLVILIIGLITVIALPTVIPAIEHRQTIEAARLLQGALIGARDEAIRSGQPSGIRLIADPDLPGAYSRVVPIGPAPEYSEGIATVRSGATYPGQVAGSRPWLVLEQAAADGRGLPAAPTSWFWNVRVGDRIQLDGAGPWYTVAGPMVVPSGGMIVTDCGNPPTSYFVANPEMYVNSGSPDCPSPLVVDGVAVEYLLLVNGRDDNANGWTDDGWDGVDNDGINGVDDPAESEVETWIGAAAGGLRGVPYVIRRRPYPIAVARESPLPGPVVIDAARSALPVVAASGQVEILIRPDGTAEPSRPYGVPSGLPMGSSWMHFALVDRSDVGTGAAPKRSWAVLSLQARTGRIAVSEDPDPANPFAGAMRGMR